MVQDNSDKKNIRVIGIREAASMTSLSISTIKRMVRFGKFPKPIQLSAQRVGWVLGDIEEWIDNRPTTCA